MDEGKEILSILKELILKDSPTGYHEKVMDYVREELTNAGIAFKTTNKGAVIAKISGKSAEGLLYSAHTDTLGGMVKSIKDKGTLEFTLIGGYMFNTLESENCKVMTSDGKLISGTVQTTKPSVHIDSNEAKTLERVQANMEVVLDERVSSKDDVAKLGIGVGDFVFMDPKLMILDNGFVKSRYLDDKASAAVLLAAAKKLKDMEPERSIYFFISNYEEVGHGASAGIPEEITEFIAVDMGAPGNNQNSSEFKVNICAKDSTGPYDYTLRKRLVSICERESIPYAVDIYPSYGSDASAALSAGHDLRTGLIGPGVFASHGYERTHLDSLMATFDLVVKYAMEKA
jgi:putative aminopeptidase FrvX